MRSDHPRTTIISPSDPLSTHFRGPWSGGGACDALGGEGEAPAEPSEPRYSCRAGGHLRCPRGRNPAVHREACPRLWLSSRFSACPPKTSHTRAVRGKPPMPIRDSMPPEGGVMDMTEMSAWFKNGDSPPSNPRLRPRKRVPARCLSPFLNHAGNAQRREGTRVDQCFPLENGLESAGNTWCIGR